MTRAFDWARPDGVVLLSPAAPSYGHFRDYRDRGEAFTPRRRHLSLPLTGWLQPAVTDARLLLALCHNAAPLPG